MAADAPRHVRDAERRPERQPAAMIVLIVGFAMTLACLVFQALASVAAARYFAHQSRRTETSHPARTIFLQFSMLMIILMLGNILQIVLWAVLYRVFGAIGDFEDAL